MLRSLLVMLLLLYPDPFYRQVDGRNKTLTIAVASSLANPLKEIAHIFEKQNHITTNLSFASSGVLTAQILHGAPFDLFISANLAYPQKLNQIHKTVKAPEIFALGTLVLWSSSPLNGHTPCAVLSNEQLQTIAIAHPELAPFGMAAVTWLKEQKLYNNVKSQLVFGENVGMVNHFIASGSVDAALTSISALHTPQLSKKGHWRRLTSQATDIPHGVVIIKKEEPKDTQNSVQKFFVNFLFSEVAQAVFQRYGYRKPKDS